RQCYYASFAPGAGLIFPPTAAVYQVYGPSQDRDPNRRLNWDQQQNLQRGFIRSRTLSQFISMETRPAQTPFSVRPAAGDTTAGDTTAGDAAATLAVKSGLAQAVPLLIVRDRAGNYYWGAVPANGSAELLRQPDVELLRKNYVEQLLARRKPAKTLRENGWQVQPADRFPVFSVVRPFGAAADSMDPVGRSVLERYLSAPWFGAGAGEMLQPGQFLALVDEAPGLSIGVQNVTEESSLHLLFGEW
ncbi:MAG: hypothetical protein ACKOBW_07260, partial [Planctomycetota bacterium]